MVATGDAVVVGNARTIATLARMCPSPIMRIRKDPVIIWNSLVPISAVGDHQRKLRNQAQAVQRLH
jgi:hypothetical protein